MSYQNDPNSTSKKSKTDIVFLVIFFISLFIPILNIDKSEISEFENRALAKFIPIIENNKINYNFGEDFDNWFNDRFFLRNFMIQIYGNYIISLNDYLNFGDVLYNKKYDFSFSNGIPSNKVYMKDNPFSMEKLESIFFSMYKLQEYCKDNNVKLYIMLSNDKESIYPEFYPKYYIPAKNLTKLQQLKAILKAIPGLTVISPTEKLIEEKEKNLVFEPYDGHLSGIGIYIEYSSIINSIQKHYPQIKPIKLSDIEFIKSDHRCDILPPEKYIREEYKYKTKIELKNSFAKISEEKNINNYLEYTKYTNNKSHNTVRAVIIGDSFHQLYKHMLAENFYTLKSVSFGAGGFFILDDETKSLLFDEKPDILIIETTERFLERFLWLYSFFDIFENKYRSNNAV